ncbi:outer membrane protein assembly factor BamD [Treponema sp. OMZ 787]|uniref:outer membrane protein assembly factor BamD n=1 Tax=Treponema sp. OMZ 787 TaxID=2563669 RepID=UPI0020A295A7|nr:outer membrane protein assembly factor BamD [Treponema sp. OMZ 787]UTC61534.1 outer membrane protein assembly factor BamD [Treponema sp. OMZ 787]
MKFSIRFTLIVFLIFIFFNSCASTKKNSDENLNLSEDRKPEVSVTNDIEPKSFEETEDVKKSENIIVMKVPENTQKAKGILPKKNEDSILQDKDSEQYNDSEKVLEADSEKSVSDPKPVADKPSLELIIDTEDDNDTALSNNYAADLPSVINGYLLTEPKEKQLERPILPAPNQPLITMPEKKQALKPDTDIAEAPINNDAVNEEKIKDTDPVRVFSEFPSTEPDETKEEKASRSVNVYTGQRLEVVYPGEGWVYLGESSAQKGIKYQQRKLQNGTSTFHFGALNEGSYILNFSHFDVFSDNFISDSIAVHVEKTKTKLSDTVKAPDYKGPVNAQMEKKSDVKNEKKYSSNKSDAVSAGTPVKPDSSIKKNENEKVYDSPDILTVTEKPESKIAGKEFKSASELLGMIRGYISEGNSSDAINSADNFFKNYSENLDEALFLRGQAYELNGPNKNVKKALEAYQTLTKAYPQSKFWDKADARIRYIKKFYIDIK